MDERRWNVRYGSATQSDARRRAWRRIARSLGVSFALALAALACDRQGPPEPASPIAVRLAHSPPLQCNGRGAIAIGLDAIVVQDVTGAPVELHVILTQVDPVMAFKPVLLMTPVGADCPAMVVEPAITAADMIGDLYAIEGRIAVPPDDVRLVAVSIARNHAVGSTVRCIPGTSCLELPEPEGAVSHVVLVDVNP